MVLSAHQLHYLPWLRYFHKIASSDVFVALDDIQFNKNGWQNRNKVKASHGWVYLTVPVRHRSQQRLDDVRIDNARPWGKKHLGTLVQNYSRAPHFNEHLDFLEKLYARRWESLNDINLEMLFHVLAALGTKTKVIRSSELAVAGIASERIVNICRQVGADTYLTGAYALDVYLDRTVFQRAGVAVAIQEWQCPQYAQQFPAAGFIPDLSIADLLFNHGPRSLEILFNSGAAGHPDS